LRNDPYCVYNWMVEAVEDPVRMGALIRLLRTSHK